MPASDIEKIKKPNTKSDFRSDSAKNLMELAQCIEDPLYFMKTFMKIQHPTLGSLPFKPYPYQERIIKAFHKYRFTINMTARQAGKTTCSAGFLLWKAMFTPDTTILVAANKYSQALEIMDRIRYAYENLPDHIRAGVTEYNKGTITFDNNSKIVSRATSGDSGRGLSISLLYVDEFAFVQVNKQKDFWTSMAPVLSTGGACIVTSTPKNDEDQFAQLWKAAIDTTDEHGNPSPDGLGKNGWHAEMAKWDEVPGRDEEWARPFRESLGEARFKQEFECEFLSDDETLINPLTLQRLRGVDASSYTGATRWYSDPQPNKAYLVALDPSQGTGGDNAAIQVFELSGKGMIQVAEWQHNLTRPKEQVAMLKQILHILEEDMNCYEEQMGDPDIYWSVENNSMGDSILQIIEHTGEEKFPGMFVSERRRPGQTRKLRKGMNTNKSSKASACVRLKSLIESDRMIIKSKNLLKELKNFVASEGSFKAKPGEQDDLVMATLLAVRLLDMALLWGADMDELKEQIDDEEFGYQEPMPVVV